MHTRSHHWTFFYLLPFSSLSPTSFLAFIHPWFQPVFTSLFWKFRVYVWPHTYVLDQSIREDTYNDHSPSYGIACKIPPLSPYYLCATSCDIIPLFPTYFSQVRRNNDLGQLRRWVFGRGPVEIQSTFIYFKSLFFPPLDWHSAFNQAVDRWTQIRI